MATRPDLRVSDADREATAASLREHFALGRLSHEEFDQRLSAAFAAVTQRDLDAVTSDLPHVRTPVAPLPVAGFTTGSQSGSSRAGSSRAGSSRAGSQGQGRASSARRGLSLAFGLVSALVVLLVLTAPLWLNGFAFFGGVRGWGVLTVVLVIIRSIVRRIFGLRRGGGRPGRHYTDYGRNGRPW
ncbi:MAG TPA: DUF1707 domain-containing protein [Streptosporangiaceae bacterium]|nr:DUF1707 domain-containing protein [Streptosporangiaceae bacterium]